MSVPEIPSDLYTPKLNSWVWKHAQLSRAFPEYVWCCVPGCKPGDRRVSRKDGTTSNITYHLRHSHRLKDGTPSTVAHNTLEKYSQPKSVPPCSHAFGASMDSLITQFFISNCLPFNVAATPSYSALFHFATGGSYEPPKRTKLTATADELYSAMVEVLAADVKDNTISITTDAATLDNGHSYITITAHYITHAMQMRDVTLMVQKMTRSHTGDYVSELLDATITTWHAEERCFAVVTDNGANFVRGARLATTVQDELRCACHTLQLALKDSVAGEAVLKQLCADAQHVVVTIRRSQLLTDELNDIQKLEIAAASVDDLPGGEDEKVPDSVRVLKLALNVPTRFNSLWFLLSRLLQVKSSVQTVCRARPALFDGKVLTPSQWEMIAELLQVLTPVKELCDDLESSLRPSVSLLIPLTMQLCQLLGELHPTLKLDSCRSVCDKVRTSVYSRMLSALDDPLCTVAMLLDPRVRNWVIPHYNEAAAIDRLRTAFLNFPSRLAEYRGQSVSLRHGEREVEAVEAKEPEPKRVRLLQLPQKRAVAASTASELDLYLLEEGIPYEQCPLEWWMGKKTRFPVLFEMARVYLAIPASSAPSERVFSAGGLVLADKRRQLLECRVARLMFMKRNMSLYTVLTANKSKK